MIEPPRGGAKGPGQGGGLLEWLSQNFPPAHAAAAQELEALVIELQRDAAVARLLSGIAHELSNMLAPVAGFAELMEAAPELAEQTRRWAKILRENATRSADFTRTLLAFGHQSRGPREALGGRGVLDSVLELVRYHLQRARARTEVAVDPELPFVEARPGELQHVFLNIVLRAADRLEALGGGTLAVRGGAGEDGTVVFEFAAHAGARAPEREAAAPPPAAGEAAGGEGIAPGSRTAEAEAALPLLVARRVAERLGGTLAVEEEKASAIYRLTLPAWRTA